jgi:hypothetical protein
VRLRTCCLYQPRRFRRLSGQKRGTVAKFGPAVLQWQRDVRQKARRSGMGQAFHPLRLTCRACGPHVLIILRGAGPTHEHRQATRETLENVLTSVGPSEANASPVAQHEQRACDNDSSGVSRHGPDARDMVSPHPTPLALRHGSSFGSTGIQKVSGPHGNGR